MNFSIENYKKRNTIMMIAGALVAFIFSFIPMLSKSESGMGVTAKATLSYLKMKISAGGFSMSMNTWDKEMDGPKCVLVGFILIIVTLIVAVIPMINKFAAAPAVLAIIMIIVDMGKFSDAVKDYDGSTWTLIVMILGLAVTAAGSVLEFLGKE